MSIIGLGSVSAQSQNVKCTYAATHVISDAVKNIEDAHIREMENILSAKAPMKVILA